MLLSSEFKLYGLIIVGQLIINLPVILISFGAPIITSSLIENLAIRIILSILVFIIGLILSWIYWSFMITKWRIWAFKKVNENQLLLLKKLAITSKLIWEDRAGFEATEIRNKFDNQIIDAISEQINEAEQIAQIKIDLATPNKIVYSLSTRDILIESFSMIIFLAVGISQLFTELFFLGIIIIIVISFSSKRLLYLYSLIKGNENLEISNQGISIGYPLKKFIFWESIMDVEIIRDSATMRIEYIDLDVEKSIEIELWRYQIKDHVLLSKRIDVFAERFMDRWRRRSALDN